MRHDQGPVSQQSHQALESVRSTDLANRPHCGLADSNITVFQKGEKCGGYLRDMDEPQIGGGIRANGGSPRSEPGQIVPDESEQLVQLGNCVSAVASEIQRESQQNRLDQLSVESTQLCKLIAGRG